MNSKRQVKGKLGHVLLLEVNVMLNLSYNDGQAHLSALLLCSFVW